MKNIIYKFVVVLALLLIGAVLINVKTQNLTEGSQQTEIDSVNAGKKRRSGVHYDAYSVRTAKDKLQSGEAQLLVQNGAELVIYEGEELFKEKFGVDYKYLGCVVRCTQKEMVQYNTVLMDYLTAKFGNEWRNFIREDVSGLDEYGVDAFKDIVYDENGTATMILPVIYKSLGRSASSTPSAIKEIIGCEPLTSLGFMYRGNEYYMPLSCNFDIEELPLENELIEVTIRIFSPKVFRYSKSIKPYPFSVIESINLLK